MSELVQTCPLEKRLRAQPPPLNIKITDCLGIYRSYIYCRPQSLLSLGDFRRQSRMHETFTSMLNIG